MPSSRRIRTTLVLAVTAVLVLIYVTTGPSSTRSSEFYTRTVQKLDAKHKADAVAEKLDSKRIRTGKGRSGDTGIETPDSAERIAPAAQGKVRQQAFGEAPAKKDKNPITGKDLEDDEGSHAHAGGLPASRQRSGVRKAGKKIDDEARAGEDDGVAKVGNTGKDLDGAGSAAEQQAVVKPKKNDDPVIDAVEKELDAILKMSPIIFFSKSYCPYCAKAKKLLLQKYKIVPAPHVVELDLHPRGTQLQDALFKVTGRKTVPNILVNGKSIGGGDDIADLESRGKLKDELIRMGGKRLMEVKLA